MNAKNAKIVYPTYTARLKVRMMRSASYLQNRPPEMVEYDKRFRGRVQLRRGESHLHSRCQLAATTDAVL